MKFSLSSLFVSILMVSILTIILSLLMRNEKLYELYFLFCMERT